MRSRASLAVALAATVGVVLSLGLARGAQSASKTIQEGVYTAEQVDAGKVVFEGVCSECHMPIEFGPDYMVGWSGATVGDFFEQILATMPFENPGSLEPREYADVLTYIFSINGVATGEQKMSADGAELQSIVIDGPYTWAGDRDDR